MFQDYMKQCDEVIKLLREQIKKEAGYNQKFVDARKEVKERELQRVSVYNKFKNQQQAERKLNERLNDFLKRA